ncbi:hypothetical protein SpAn4DRAFT_0295 [Sporomusa ovata]|uniref:Uncharacterized protein n=1 Tax=Sporomusa ovata TaxID=2378 RepID=A0A0U1L3Z6_9FIRM|nr:hypothetical protein SpAn4DRAFT_0295 [Sporomusa ovata]
MHGCSLINCFAASACPKEKVVRAAPCAILGAGSCLKKPSYKWDFHPSPPENEYEKTISFRR